MKAVLFMLAVVGLALSGCGTSNEVEDFASTEQALLSDAISVGSTWTGKNAMQVYELESTRTVQTRWKVDPNNADGAWTAWTNFGSVTAQNANRIRATRYANLAQLVVVSGNTNQIQFKTQTSPDGAWSGWSNIMAGPPGNIQDVALTLTLDSRIDLIVATDYGLYHAMKANVAPDANPLSNWIIMDNNGHLWEQLDTGNTRSVAAARQGASEHVFYVGGGTLYVLWASVVDPQSLRQMWQRTPFNAPQAVGPITVGFNASGNMQVFAEQNVGSDIVSRWKTAGENSGWSNWSSIGGTSGLLSGGYIYDFSANIGNTGAKRMHLFGVANYHAAPYVRWVNNGTFNAWQPFN
jgi:hypothetical protein